MAVDIVPFFAEESAYCRRRSAERAALEGAGRREATVRDASTLGYRVILVADACAAVRDQDHNATLHVVYGTYGDVRSRRRCSP